MDNTLTPLEKPQIKAILHDIFDEKLREVPLDVPRNDNMNISEAVEYLGSLGYKMSRSSIYKHIQAHDFPHHRFLNTYVFLKEEVRQWADDYIRQHTIN